MDDMRMTGEPRGTGVTSAATGFVVGAVVGAGIALLLAPRTGEETRRKLGHVAGRIGDTARDGMGKAKEVLGNLRRDAGDAAHAGMEAAQQSREDAESRYQS